MARRAATIDFRAVLAEVGTDGPPSGSDADTEAMMDATSLLLGAYGLRRWSMGDVAERTGLARATVYRRFESREQLVRATLIRDARRLFAAIADAVDSTATIEDQVVEGFVVGVELARLSPITRLLEADPAAALALVTSDSILLAGRKALVESYQSVTGRPVTAADRPRVEAVAEALVRLALSLLVTRGILTGGPVGGPSGPGRPDTRQALAAVVRPLVTAPAPAGPGRPVRLGAGTSTGASSRGGWPPPAG